MRGKVSITVEKDNYKYLVDSGVNVSALADAAYAKEAKRIKGERWKEENREGMEELAAFNQKFGSFADENRKW
ncbi:type II toxin-antitoxin system CcdA family antitoxin [Pantoea sp. JGM49]|jgi:Post-segregation antitoxin (ccd killing mechanism protein) encoded by the F plasmid|uniref:type II toxin-antitoxin system CcdA family antitoxin n=1 Tax=Enterobacterales TaxID=91347 RepID=UPI000536700F|nr:MULTISPECIES: type II toxin-antitoxin system CcdA family antitoxin [Enterobacterales]KGT87424.1 plasmid maintenance protein CcdA [Enterobacter cancerogenus]MBS0882071.1 type II toxin-antitoxin system CcdA family antitoxin [Pantoea sp. JGM49]MDI9280262.1 type II toxin-antitoxin system CcdA family antitoxin [Pantoea sp. EABMAA-21]MXP55133.1 hypothetical protein [Pantoea sp. Seng]MXP57718.1 hypothetical protein [Pantoea sp. Taur]